jgi:hypothetical protein
MPAARPRVYLSRLERDLLRSYPALLAGSHGAEVAYQLGLAVREELVGLLATKQVAPADPAHHVRLGGHQFAPTSTLHLDIADRLAGAAGRAFGACAPHGHL